MPLDVVLPVGRRDASRERPREIERWPRVAVLVAGILVLLGIALRAWQYAFDRSLWLDESGIALNVLARTGRGLLGVLDYGQMAPSGFLALEKAVTLVFGPSEWAFRVWPFVAGVAALIILAATARRLLPPAGGLVAIGLFAVNHRLVYYASEAKQYSGDVLAAVLLLALAERASRGPLSRARALGLGAAGALAGWVSHPALFVLAGVGAALVFVYARRGDRASLRLLAATLVVWALCLSPVLFLDLRSVGDAADRTYMVRSWSGGFPPVPLWRRASLAWLATAPFAFVEYLLDAGPFAALAAAILCVAGAIRVARDSGSVAALLLLPPAAGLAASVLRLLPLSERVGLWVSPSVVLVAGFGIAALGSFGGSGARWAAALAGAALVAVTCAATLGRLPEGREELRPVLAALSARPGADDLYVYYGAVPAFRYYAPRFPALPENRREGACARNQWRRYLEEIVPVGQAVRRWVVLSHRQQPEADFILRSLDQLGSRIDVVEATGASAYLYSFSGVTAERLDQLARTIPAERRRAEPDWVCLGGPLSPRNWPGWHAGVAARSKP